jgi:hypothetical protein
MDEWVDEEGWWHETWGPTHCDGPPTRTLANTRARAHLEEREAREAVLPLGQHPLRRLRHAHTEVERHQGQDQAH